MKKLDSQEMRKVIGGRWQCKRCKKKFGLWYQLFTWGWHKCVRFKYKWVW